MEAQQCFFSECPQRFCPEELRRACAAASDKLQGLRRRRLANLASWKLRVARTIFFPSSESHSVSADIAPAVKLKAFQTWCRSQIACAIDCRSIKATARRNNFPRRIRLCCYKTKLCAKGCDV